MCATLVRRWWSSATHGPSMPPRPRPVRCPRCWGSNRWRGTQCITLGAATVVAAHRHSPRLRSMPTARLPCRGGRRAAGEVLLEHRRHLGSLIQRDLLAATRSGVTRLRAPEHVDELDAGHPEPTTITCSGGTRIESRVGHAVAVGRGPTRDAGDARVPVETMMASASKVKLGSRPGGRHHGVVVEQATGAPTTRATPWLSAGPVVVLEPVGDAGDALAHRLEVDRGVGDPQFHPLESPIVSRRSPVAIMALDGTQSHRCWPRRRCRASMRGDVRRGGGPPVAAWVPAGPRR